MSHESFVRCICEHPDDDETVLTWARVRWPKVDFTQAPPWGVCFWVLSQAARDGHE